VGAQQVIKRAGKFVAGKFVALKSSHLSHVTEWVNYIAPWYLEDASVLLENKVSCSIRMIS
jgi:hypothetical protein